MDKVRRSLKGITSVLFKEQSRILGAAATLMVLTLLTKFSGMLFTALLAQKFGASRPTDIFNAANAIPEMITTVVLVGAVSGSVIPVLIKVRINEDKDMFMDFFSSLLNVGLIFFLIISIFVIVFSHDIVNLAMETGVINPVTPFSPEELRQIGDIMRYLMIPQAILGVSAFVSSALNAYERFIIPSLAPLFYNLGRILGVFIIVDLLGGSIFGVVWGTLFGALLHLAIQIPLLRHLEINYKFILNLRISYIKDVLNLSLPRVISLSGEQISLTISKIIAISLKIGSLSAFNYAWSLIAIPLSLFGVSFAIASFPSFSKFYEKGDYRSFSRLFRRVGNQIMFLTIPTAAIIFVLRLPLTRLFFGILGGEFNWEDTRQVAWVIFFFSFGLPFETLRSFLYRVFYSLHDSTKPLIASLLVMFVGIISSIGFTNYFSHYDSFRVSLLLDDVNIVTYSDKEEFPFFEEVRWNHGFIDKFKTRGDGNDAVGGLGLATTVVFTLEFVLLMILLWRKNIIDNLDKFLGDLAKKFIAGFGVIGLSYFLFKYWESFLSTAKTLNLLFLTGSTIFASLMFYLWISYILRIPEVDLLLDYLQIYWYKVEKRFPFLSRIRKLL